MRLTPALMALSSSNILPCCGATVPERTNGSHCPHACPRCLCDEHAIACLAYPSGEYKGYNFVAAAFSVPAISGINEGEGELARVCDVPFHRATINRIKFRTVNCGEVGLGSSYYTELYRTCHEGTCYELDVMIATSEYANYDPGTIKRFTAKDCNRVRGRLKRMVDTFRFLKQPQSTSPHRTANRTRSVTLCTLSFSMMRPRCASTV